MFWAFRHKQFFKRQLKRGDTTGPCVQQLRQNFFRDGILKPLRVGGEKNTKGDKNESDY
jgi:hypothetical protein